MIGRMSSIRPGDGSSPPPMIGRMSSIRPRDGSSPPPMIGRMSSIRPGDGSSPPPMIGRMSSIRPRDGSPPPPPLHDVPTLLERDRCLFEGGEFKGECRLQLDRKGCTYYVVAMFIDDHVPQKSEQFHTQLERWLRSAGYSQTEKTARNYNRQVADHLPDRERHEVVFESVASLRDASVISMDTRVGSHVVYVRQHHGGSETGSVLVCDPWCGKMMEVPNEVVRTWENVRYYRLTIRR